VVSGEPLPVAIGDRPFPTDASPLIVPEGARGTRLDAFLAARFGGISRMRLRQAIAEGDVTVEGVVRTAGWKLRAGNVVQVRLEDVGPTAMTPEAIPVPVLFEDEHLAVVEKPAGMVVHPTKHWRGGTLTNALAYHFNRQPGAPVVRPGIVHRLDRHTSGLMVVAKSEGMLRRLTIAFQERRVEKRYLALVYGAVTNEEGVVEAPIGRDMTLRPRWGVRPTGRPAETRFRVHERLPHHTLLEMEPVTGRTNQLRIHAAHTGHPMVGDPEFGRDVVAERYASLQQQFPPPRLFLHAAHLAFEHPATQATLSLNSPLPPGLSEYLTRVRAASNG
jgi:23S rRNA pseudouridine1911/1915/1917 synthase